MAAVVLASRPGGATKSAEAAMVRPPILPWRFAMSELIWPAMVPAAGAWDRCPSGVAVVSICVGVVTSGQGFALSPWLGEEGEGDWGGERLSLCPRRRNGDDPDCDGVACRSMM